MYNHILSSEHYLLHISTTKFRICKFFTHFFCHKIVDLWKGVFFISESEIRDVLRAILTFFLWPLAFVVSLHVCAFFLHKVPHMQIFSQIFSVKNRESGERSYFYLKTSDSRFFEVNCDIYCVSFRTCKVTKRKKHMLSKIYQKDLNG